MNDQVYKMDINVNEKQDNKDLIMGIALGIGIIPAAYGTYKWIGKLIEIHKEKRKIKH